TESVGRSQGLWRPTVGLRGSGFSGVASGVRDGGIVIEASKNGGEKLWRFVWSSPANRDRLTFPSDTNILASPEVAHAQVARQRGGGVPPAGRCGGGVPQVRLAAVPGGVRRNVH